VECSVRNNDTRENTTDDRGHGGIADLLGNRGREVANVKETLIVEAITITSSAVLVNDDVTSGATEVGARNVGLHEHTDDSIDVEDLVVEILQSLSARVASTSDDLETGEGISSEEVVLQRSRAARGTIDVIFVIRLNVVVHRADLLVVGELVVATAIDIEGDQVQNTRSGQGEVAQVNRSSQGHGGSQLINQTANNVLEASSHTDDARRGEGIETKSDHRQERNLGGSGAGGAELGVNTTLVNCVPRVHGDVTITEGSGGEGQASFGVQVVSVATVLTHHAGEVLSELVGDVFIEDNLLVLGDGDGTSALENFFVHLLRVPVGVGSKNSISVEVVLTSPDQVHDHEASVFINTTVTGGPDPRPGARQEGGVGIEHTSIIPSGDGIVENEGLLGGTREGLGSEGDGDSRSLHATAGEGTQSLIDFSVSGVDSVQVEVSGGIVLDLEATSVIVFTHGETSLAGEHGVGGVATIREHERHGGARGIVDISQVGDQGEVRTRRGIDHGIIFEVVIDELTKSNGEHVLTIGRHGVLIGTLRQGVRDSTSISTGARAGQGGRVCVSGQRLHLTDLDPGVGLNALVTIKEELTGGTPQAAAGNDVVASTIQATNIGVRAVWVFSEGHSSEAQHSQR